MSRMVGDRKKDLVAGKVQIAVMKKTRRITDYQMRARKRQGLPTVHAPPDRKAER